MGTAIQADEHPFVRKIESIALFDLSSEERRALETLPMQATDHDAHQDIVTEHDRPSRCFAVLMGIAAAYKTTEEGRR